MVHTISLVTLVRITTNSYRSSTWNISAIALRLKKSLRNIIPARGIENDCLGVIGMYAELLGSIVAAVQWNNSLATHTVLQSVKVLDVLVLLIAQPLTASTEDAVSPAIVRNVFTAASTRRHLVI